MANPKNYTRSFEAVFRLATKEEADHYGTYLDKGDASITLGEDGMLQFHENAPNSGTAYGDYDEHNISALYIGFVKPDTRIQTNGTEWTLRGNPDKPDMVDFYEIEDGIIGIHIMQKYYYYDDPPEDQTYIDSEFESFAQAYGKDLLDAGVPLIPFDLPIPEEEKERYVMSEHDFNRGTAFNQIISGETGCGKTYKAINDEIDAGRRFAYIAPCRQLAYETFRYYADPQKDVLSTGEIKINTDQRGGNFYGVFESLSPEKLKRFDTLIIDEAHFIKDEDRGSALLDLIAECRERNVNIKLLTATPSFSLNDFEEIELKSRFKIPEKVEIDEDEALQNIDKGMQTICFCGSIKQTEEWAQRLRYNGVRAMAVNSSMTPSERLKAQIAFENKEIQVVCCTNVLAQGVNFECENLIVDYDRWETDEQFQQKLGRLGRPGTLEGKNQVYYCAVAPRDKPHKDKTKTKIHHSKRENIVAKSSLEDVLSFVKRGSKYDDKEILEFYTPSYEDVKYCIPEFMQYVQNFKYEREMDAVQSMRKSIISGLDTLCKSRREDLPKSDHSEMKLHKNDLIPYTDYEIMSEGMRNMNSLINNLGSTFNTFKKADANALKELSQNIENVVNLIFEKGGYDQEYDQLMKHKNELEIFCKKCKNEYKRMEPIAKRAPILQSSINEKKILDDASEMIREEQASLRTVILSNMRHTPELTYAKEPLDKSELVNKEILQQKIDELISNADQNANLNPQVSVQYKLAAEPLIEIMETDNISIVDAQNIVNEYLEQNPNQAIKERLEGIMRQVDRGEDIQLENTIEQKRE